MIALINKPNRIFDRYLSCSSISWEQARAIVIPLIAENLFTVLFGLLNTGMISSSGVTSLSAVSLVDTLNSFLFVFYSGIATGASVIIANYRGRNDKEQLHKSSVQSISAVTLFSIATTAFVIVFQTPLLQLLFGSVEQDIMDKAKLYMLGGAITLPLCGFCSAVSGVLRGIGEGKTALIITILSSAIYVILNIVFLKILDMGIPGLILSITLQRLIQLVLSLVLIKQTNSKFTCKFKELLHLDIRIFKSIANVGLPCAVEQLFFNGGRLVMQVIVAPMGTNAIVIYNIAYSIMHLNQAIASPINSAMFTVVGMCLGNRSTADARLMTKRYVILNFFLYIVMFGLIMLCFPLLVRFYNAPAETIDTIRICTIITGLAHPVLHSIGFTLPSTFRAAGDGLYCTVSVLIIMWVVRVFGGLVLGTWCGWGVMGVWVAMVLDWVVRTVIFPIRFRGDKWLKHNIFAD